MQAYVLDACAMMAYLAGEPGASVVEELLSDPHAACYAHAVNLCEVFYGAIRESDEDSARRVIEDIRAAGVVERKDMSRKFWRRVGTLKAGGRTSLADCFAITLAQELGAELVTSDHHEFDPLVPLGIVPIRFIR